MTKKNKILVVEDERSLATGLEFNLTEEGYEVSIASDGKMALESFQGGHFNLIILDIMLPYINGYEVASQILKISPQIPILMLTAKTSINDKIMGLQSGAHDYMTKPFHLDELLERIKGMLKRSKWYQSTLENSPVYYFGDNKINFKNLSCSNHHTDFHLTHHEAMVLKYLIENSGRIISRNELLKNVWNIESKIETRTVDNFIARLRKYFEKNPKHPVFIKSIRSAGYIFSPK